MTRQDDPSPIHRSRRLWTTKIRSLILALVIKNFLGILTETELLILVRRFLILRRSIILSRLFLILARCSSCCILFTALLLRGLLLLPRGLLLLLFSSSSWPGDLSRLLLILGALRLFIFQGLLSRLLLFLALKVLLHRSSGFFQPLFASFPVSGDLLLLCRRSFVSGDLSCFCAAWLELPADCSAGPPAPAAFPPVPASVCLLLLLFCLLLGVLRNFFSNRRATLRLFSAAERRLQAQASW